MKVHPTEFSRNATDVKYALLFLLIVVHILDIVTTRWLFNMGVLEHGGVELNPLMEQWVMDIRGILLKTVVLIPVSYLCIKNVISTRVVVVCVIISSIVLLSNLYAVALYTWVV